MTAKQKHIIWQKDKFIFRLNNHMITFIICLGILIPPCAVQAIEITPFYTQNQSPIIQIFGLPSIGEAAVLSKGKGAIRLTMDLANNYTTEGNAQERVLFDGESARFSLNGRYGMGRKLEIGMEIPYIITGGGFLDTPIENYHQTFGFPNGGRESVPRKRILYQYEKNGKMLLNMNQSGAGLGDTSLTGGWQLYENDKNAGQGLAVRASLKLPTGSTEFLQGSGSTDLALWVVGSDNFKMSIGHLTIFGAAGIMTMTTGKVLPDQQRPLVGFGALGVGWAPVDKLAFKIQTNAHTSFFRGSTFKQVNGNSAQLTLGGSAALSQETSLDIGVTEDIVVKASPDVVFHLSFAHRF